MSKSLLASVLAVAAVVGTSSFASAGFSVSLLNTPVTQTGATITTNSPGSLAGYSPDGGFDPVITPSQLTHFQLTFSLTAPVLPGPITGTYFLYYDVTLDGLTGDDKAISGGNLAWTAGILNPDNGYPLDGSIVQTSGPAAGLPDLSYGGSPLSFTGFYRPVTVTNTVADVSGTIIQSAVAVPEPTALGLILPAIPLLARRRR